MGAADFEVGVACFAMAIAGIADFEVVGDVD